MSKNEQSGGVNVSGVIGSIAGDVVGRDKVTTSTSSVETISGAIRPLEEALQSAPPEKKQEAEAKLKQIESELGKGERRDDTVVAKLLDSFVKLVPAAATAVVSAFGAPILAGMTGPVTKYVLDRFRGNDDTTTA